MGITPPPFQGMGMDKQLELICVYACIHTNEI